jgi:Na+-driven multidrug efflux pump
MLTQMLGAVFNIVMDPDYDLRPAGLSQKLGVAGAAMATVLGQILLHAAGAVVLPEEEPGGARCPCGASARRREIVRDIYAVGLPSIVMESIGSVMTYGMNRILLAFTTTAAAVFGVYFKLDSFIFMPAFGLTNGLVPIMGYNYGARNKARILRALRLGILYAMLVIMACGTLAFQLIPRAAAAAFQRLGRHAGHRRARSAAYRDQLYAGWLLHHLPAPCFRRWATASTA